MSNFYTSSDLIKSCKQRAFIPENQSTFTKDDFLRFANEELLLALVPYVRMYHEDHFLVTRPSPLVSNINRYEIPYRALGNSLKELAFQDVNNNIAEMTRINREDLPYYQNNVNTTTPYSYFLESNEIVLTPGVGDIASGSLLFTYYIRPNKLVLEERAGKIINIDLTAGEITVEKLPVNFSTSILFDFIKNDSPHKVIDFDKSCIGVNSTAKVVTFDPDNIPQGLKVGDYLMEAQETIIPPVPSELHVLLAQMMACRCLEAMGDQQGLTNAVKKLEEMMRGLEIVIENRVEGSPQKIINRHGHLRGSMGARNRTYWR